LAYYGRLQVVGRNGATHRLRGEAGLEREKMGIFYEFFVTQQKDQPKICEIGFII